MGGVKREPSLCGNCGAKDPRLRCPCKDVYFCNIACQRRQWRNHKKQCTFDLIKKVDADRATLGRDAPAIGPACVKIGGLLRSRGMTRDAEKWLEEGLRVYRVVHAGREDNEAMYMPLTQLGSLYYDQERYEEGMKLFDQALRIARREYGDKHILVGGVLNDMATGLNKLSRPESYAEALEKFTETHEIFCSHYGEDHELSVSVLVNIATILHNQGKRDEALKIREKLAKRKIETEESQLLLAQSCLCAGKLDKAIEALEVGFELVQANHPGRCAMEGCYYQEFGNVYRKKGMFKEALKMLKKAQKVFEKTTGSATRDSWAVCEDMACLLNDQGKLDKAIEMYDECISIMRTTIGDHEQFARVLYNASKTARDAGNLPKVVEYLTEADSVYKRMGATHEEAQHVAFLANNTDFLETMVARNGQFAQAQNREEVGELLGGSSRRSRLTGGIRIEDIDAAIYNLSLG